MTKIKSLFISLLLTLGVSSAIAGSHGSTLDLVKERGMTLDGAKKQLKQKNNSLSKNSILLKLKNIKSELKELSDQL